MSPDREEGEAGASTVTLTFPRTGNAARMPTGDSRVKGTQCCAACWSSADISDCSSFLVDSED